MNSRGTSPTATPASLPPTTPGSTGPTTSRRIGRTAWVMGFNYEVGPDNMVHSYTHRVESMAALACAAGVWDTHQLRDPWNVFSWLELDHRGAPSMVGNCHVPPNGEGGYDYNNKRRVLSWRTPGTTSPTSAAPPRRSRAPSGAINQFGYQKWILEHLPKVPRPHLLRLQTTGGSTSRTPTRTCPTGKPPDPGTAPPPGRPAPAVAAGRALKRSGCAELTPSEAPAGLERGCPQSR
jgi:hypothetical protein